MIPNPINEPVLPYLPGSIERKSVIAALEMAREEVKELPMFIGGKRILSNVKIPVSPPHDHRYVIANINEGGKDEINEAIEAALKAKVRWEEMPWLSRISIFLKAADLVSGPYRAKLNAATMLGQSKNIYQAEIDAVCEMADFLRFNAKYVEQIYSIQPQSAPGIWNLLEHRPLEGFVFALSPFNFTAIAGNLPAAPAMLGNTVVWKPAYTQAYSASLLMEIFIEAGLPPGVINLIYADGPLVGDMIFNHPDFAGIHFTGSTKVFQNIWSIIGKNIGNYKTYPRIVGETGGKDFIVADETAHLDSLSTAIIRGAFEYQGQKCSAASRAYLPQEIWETLKIKLINAIAEIKMGPPEDFSNFINAVIDEKSFDKIVKYIEDAKEDEGTEIVAGGSFDKTYGYFIQPTILLCKNPEYITMCEEIFGPVISIYLYPASGFSQVLEIVNRSKYALTGAVFSNNIDNINLAKRILYHAAGNFYINDKPTGAVVGQQPFGGGRASGTNDKAGSILNMLRWVSPRTIKENFNPPGDYKYPFMKD